MVRVEVKAKMRKEWPAVRGINDENALLIFVDYRNKQETERPDFYILSSSDWQSYLREYILNNPGLDRLEDGYIPIWKGGVGYRGSGVTPERVAKHREKWDKLFLKLGES